MWNDFLYHIISQQPEISPFQIFVSEHLFFIPMKFLLDISLLLFVGSRNVNLLKTELRQCRPIDHASQANIFRTLTPENAAFNGIHQAHGAVIAYVMQFF